MNMGFSAWVDSERVFLNCAAIAGGLRTERRFVEKNDRTSSWDARDSLSATIKTKNRSEALRPLSIPSIFFAYSGSNPFFMAFCLSCCFCLSFSSLSCGCHDEFGRNRKWGGGKERVSN